MRNTVKRREFLLGGMAMAGLVVSSQGVHAALTGTPAATQATTPAPAPIPTAYTGLRSRPDLDGAPRLTVSKATGRGLGGYFFLTPISQASRGPAIFDTMGRLVWFQPTQASMVHNLQLVRYNGEELLAWYEGEQPSGSPGYANGSCSLYDRSYKRVVTILGHDSTPIDLHDLVVTPQGTALVEAYVPVTRDLTSLGGAANTTVLNWLLQEVEIATGKVVFSWSAMDYVSLEESVTAPPTTPGQSYDYFHGNAIEVDNDNNLIVSSRNTSAIYKINRTTGKMIWRLRGGLAAPVSGAAASPTPSGSGAYVPAFHTPAGAGGEPSPTSTAAAASAPTVPPPPDGAQDLVLQPSGESFWFQHDARSNDDGTIPSSMTGLRHSTTTRAGLCSNWTPEPVQQPSGSRIRSEAKWTMRAASGCNRTVRGSRAGAVWGGSPSSTQPGTLSSMPPLRATRTGHCAFPGTGSLPRLPQWLRNEEQTMRSPSGRAGTAQRRWTAGT